MEAGTIDAIGARYGAMPRERQGGGSRQSTKPFVAGEYIPTEDEFRVPTVVPAFNNWGALLSCELHLVDGTPTQLADASEAYASDALVASLRLEIAKPNIEARCGFGFTPSFGGVGTRVEQQEPIRFFDPGTYTVTARIQPGTLAEGLYDCAPTQCCRTRRAAVRRWSRATEDERASSGKRASVERARISLWDGDAWELAEAEWLVEQEAAKVV